MAQSCPKMWTVLVTGGKPFDFQTGINPPVSHSGGRTVAHLFMGEAEITQLRGLALLQGAVTKAWPMQGQSESQYQERQKRATSFDVAEFPSIACPNCPWVEPFQEEKCGYRSLPEESRAELLRTSEAHLEGLRDCPLAQSTIPPKHSEGH